LLLALDRGALQLPLRIVVLGLAAMRPAGTPRSIEPAIGIERVVEA
jgi:hypothetical protein